jgi:hypothetical protein
MNLDARSRVFGLATAFAWPIRQVVPAFLFALVAPMGLSAHWQYAVYLVIAIVRDVLSFILYGPVVQLRAHMLHDLQPPSTQKQRSVSVGYALSLRVAAVALLFLVGQTGFTAYLLLGANMLLFPVVALCAVQLFTLASDLPAHADHLYSLASDRGRDWLSAVVLPPGSFLIAVPSDDNDPTRIVFTEDVDRLDLHTVDLDEDALGGGNGGNGKPPAAARPRRQ